MLVLRKAFEVFFFSCLLQEYLYLVLMLLWLTYMVFILLFRPYVRSKGRKFERARGRRKSRGFKV